MGDGVRLAVWSGPRNISTALMRSWENRPDSVVFDEPLYAHYLAVSGVDHPGRDEVVAAGATDWRAVVACLLAPLPAGARVAYHKQMAHHLVPDVERSWITSLSNVLLIRDPREVVASYVRSRAHVEPDDIGLMQQVRLYDDLSGQGQAPLVIESADLLGAPETYLRALCGWLSLPFTESMLAWPPGPRDSDGVWARYWYETVRQSTGFEPFVTREVQLVGHEAEVADACRPAYERLHRLRWQL